MGEAFARKYTDEQRDAIAWAWGERNIRPAERIAALAGAGELRSQADEPLEAFHVPAQTVRDIGRRYLRRRAGLERSRALRMPARDQVEHLRRRLVSAADHELEEVERAQARRREVSPERLRGLVRVVRELAALPSSDAPAAAPSPEKGKATRGGLAGSILRAARSTSGLEPVQELQETSEDGASAENGASGRINTSDSDENVSAPGRTTSADSPRAHGLELAPPPADGPRAA